MSTSSPSTTFVCQQCGRCCGEAGYVYLAEADTHRLAEELGLSIDAFVDAYAQVGPNRGRLCLQGGKTSACVFLEDNRCRVYHARPAQCRTFPLWERGGHCCPGLSTRAGKPVD